MGDLRQMSTKVIDTFHLSVGPGLSSAIIRDIKIEVSPGGNVVVYTNHGVQTRQAEADAAEGLPVSISKDFSTVSLFGAKAALAADGSLVVSTNGTVTIRPALKELVEYWGAVVRKSREEWAASAREGPVREAQRAGYRLD